VHVPGGAAARERDVERAPHLRYHRSRAAPAAIGGKCVPRMRVVVAVLGDLGRSPRMLYHALSLADSDADVELVGYRDSELPAEVRGHARIRVWALRTEDSIRARGIGFVVRGVWRVLRQSSELARLLLRRVPAPEVVLVQNPPAVPMLLVALVTARLRRARLVVDWHNFGWSMLAARLGPSHPLVRLARAYERGVGRRADAHLCVSAAMGEVLAADGVRGAVPFHDRPATRFTPLPPDERAQLRDGLRREYGVPGDGERPLALIVSPTSWSADEDFDLLLDAARALDARLGPASPDVLVVVTGRGPLRARYEATMAGLRLGRVHLRTRWLAADAYPRFLAAADLGLSLHRSTSGVDLPMKVVDLLGAGVPVCVLDYGPCLAELVHDGVNGRLFRTADELAALLADLLAGFPAAAAPLAQLRRALAAEAGDDWPARWRAAAAPVVLGRRAP